MVPEPELHAEVLLMSNLKGIVRSYILFAKYISLRSASSEYPSGCLQVKYFYWNPANGISYRESEYDVGYLLSWTLKTEQKIHDMFMT